SLIGERVWDVSRILDVVEEKFSDIATLEGSVCVGNSGGGTATYYIACLEDRFSAYMPSCALCSFRDSIIAMQHCICNYVPGIGKYFEMGDLAMMIAPKKLVVVSGLHDNGCFPIHGAKAAFEIVQKCYKAAGAPDNCVQVIGEEGHRFYADAAWPVMHAMLAK
ncbi:MAG: alpha/beta hydrolase, partial [Clostridia bacterium]|nr:alpha/beta hydrolase [Clostridia bacterium]